MLKLRLKPNIMSMKRLLWRKQKALSLKWLKAMPIAKGSKPWAKNPMLWKRFHSVRAGLPVSVIIKFKK